MFDLLLIKGRRSQESGPTRTTLTMYCGNPRFVVCRVCLPHVLLAFYLEANTVVYLDKAYRAQLAHRDHSPGTHPSITERRRKSPCCRYLPFS